MSGHSFQEYAGNKSSPNTFSRNLIQSIAERTGTAVHIRVGGTSADFAVYDPDQQTALILPPGAVPGGIPKGMRLGRAYYEGFANFPGVQWTFMAHLANNSAGMKANSVRATQEAMKYIGSNLDAIEIGNEIDYYPNVNRPGSYNAVQYIDEWREYRAAIEQAVGKKSYQAPVYAQNNAPFSISNTFQKGQNSEGNVVAASLHHYMDSANLPASALQSHYMNHTRIAKQLDRFKAPVAYLKANQPHVPLHLGEVNSNTYSQNNADLLGVFGSCLWLVDYMLYGATLNVKRMNVQQSTGFSYTSWRGVEYNGKPAAVLPPYYAHPFVADVIGSTGDVRLADLKLGLDEFAAYGVYEAGSGTLCKVVLINLQTYRTTDGGQRPARAVTLDLGGSYESQATVDRLTAAGADVQDASHISWRGTSWTHASNGRPVQGKSTSTTVRGKGGKLGPIDVLASEAVLVTL